MFGFWTTGWNLIKLTTYQTRNPALQVFCNRSESDWKSRTVTILSFFRVIFNAFDEDCREFLFNEHLPLSLGMDNKDQFVIKWVSIYFFCCVNNKFDCLLEISQRIFLVLLPWRYVWTVEYHNLLPFYFSCARNFRCCQPLSEVVFTVVNERLFILLWGNYLFILFQDHLFQTLFISHNIFLNNFPFDWYFSFIFFLHQLLFPVRMILSCEIFLATRLFSNSFHKTIILRRFVATSFFFTAKDKHKFRKFSETQNYPFLSIVRLSVIDESW